MACVLCIERTLTGIFNQQLDSCHLMPVDDCVSWAFKLTQVNSRVICTVISECMCKVNEQMINVCIGMLSQHMSMFIESKLVHFDMKSITVTVYRWPRIGYMCSVVNQQVHVIILSKYMIYNFGVPWHIFTIPIKPGGRQYVRFEIHVVDSLV